MQSGAWGNFAAAFTTGAEVVAGSALIVVLELLIGFAGAGFTDSVFTGTGFAGTGFTAATLEDFELVAVVVRAAATEVVI